MDKRDKYSKNTFDQSRNFDNKIFDKKEPKIGNDLKKEELGIICEIFGRYLKSSCRTKKGSFRARKNESRRDSRRDPTEYLVYMHLKSLLRQNRLSDLLNISVQTCFVYRINPKET